MVFPRFPAIPVLCWAVAACAGPWNDGAPAGGDASAQVVHATATTHAVALDEDTRRCLGQGLGDGSLSVARLRIERLSARAASGLKGVQLFVARSDAGPSTPADDPHYAGSFAMGLEQEETVVLNIAPALVRLAREDDRAIAAIVSRGVLPLTLVPERWEDAPTLPDVALTFHAIRLEVACSDGGGRR